MNAEEIDTIAAKYVNTKADAEEKRQRAAEYEAGAAALDRACIDLSKQLSCLVGANVPRYVIILPAEKGHQLVTVNYVKDQPPSISVQWVRRCTR